MNMYSATGGFSTTTKIWDYPNYVRDILFENREKIIEYERPDGLVILRFTWKSKDYRFQDYDYVKAYKHVYEIIKNVHHKK
jgi:hypothetical protein